MRTIRIETPSRLHFGLIDLDGSLGRIDGSIGLALERPRFVLTARKGPAIVVEGAGPHQGRIEQMASSLQALWDVGGASITVSETVPAHSGLGSGTQAALATIHALAALYDVPLSRDQAIPLSERGGTSGIGVHAFYEGGFIVDGGHRFPEQKAAFLPSAASGKAGVGPLILRRDFPDWNLLLVLPTASHISGDTEVDLFRTLCPMPPNVALEITHRLVMGMLPALAEKDLPAFAKALASIQEVGWKKVERDAQLPVVRKTAEFLRDNGAHGVAMSSWGPALAAFTDDPYALKVDTDAFLESLPEGGTTLVTRANNSGMRIAIDDSPGPDSA